MFNLIKKDFITCLRFKSIKTVIVSLIIFMLFSSHMFYIIPTALPFFVIYIIIINSFYYDSLKESNRFIIAMPVKKEDIVYGKYLFTIILIVLMSIVTYILYGGVIFNNLREMVLQDLVCIINILLFSMTFILPLTFKYGYKKVRVINIIVTFVTAMPVLSIINLIGNKIANSSQGSEVIIGYGSVIMKFINIDYINFQTITVATTILFILSLYISLRIYRNKDIE